MANVDPALKEDIFNLTQTERKSDVVHHGELDDFRAGFELLEGGAFGHMAKLQRHRARLKQVNLTGPRRE